MPEATEIAEIDRKYRPSRAIPICDRQDRFRLSACAQIFRLPEAQRREGDLPEMVYN
jgi:hypothetical protein